MTARLSDDARTYKPAPPHNSILAPGSCMCVDCCRIMLTKRCPATDGKGHQCGDYKGHGGKEHSLIVATVFLIAEERTR